LAFSGEIKSKDGFRKKLKIENIYIEGLLCIARVCEKIAHLREILLV
jgi:hypothetical protein